jgi:hypothetical protein
MIATEGSICSNVDLHYCHRDLQYFDRSDSIHQAELVAPNLTLMKHRFSLIAL